MNNASVILAKARQQPPPAIPPSTPQPPGGGNPSGITPNPLAGAGGAMNVGPPGPGANAMPPPISTPGLPVNASGMPSISTPNMGINTMASNFGNIGGATGPLGGVGPIGGMGPIGGAPGAIGGGPMGGAGAPGPGGSIGGTPISTTAGPMGGGMNSIGAIGGSIATNNAPGVKPGPMGMPAVMQGLQNNPLANQAGVGVSCLF